MVSRNGQAPFPLVKNIVLDCYKILGVVPGAIRAQEGDTLVGAVLPPDIGIPRGTRQPSDRFSALESGLLDTSKLPQTSKFVTICYQMRKLLNLRVKKFFN